MTDQYLHTHAHTHSSRKAKGEEEGSRRNLKTNHVTVIGILSPGCYESAQSISPVRMRERIQKKIMPKLRTRAQGLGKKGCSFSQA